ncbi:MAG: universal stress protein [Burkholderiaceae bacterium]
MFSKILVASDGSPLSVKAADAAIVFASESGAQLVVLSVAVTYPLLPGAGAMVDLNAFEEAARTEAQALLEPLAAAAARAHVRCELVVRYAPDPWREIIALAEERGCDCIWMASHGRRGLERLLLGSETQRVLGHTTIPVMVYR